MGSLGRPRVQGDRSGRLCALRDAVCLVVERRLLEQIPEEHRVVQQGDIGQVHLAVALEVGELLAQQKAIVRFGSGLKPIFSISKSLSQ